jgi:hypothetical protein
MATDCRHRNQVSFLEQEIQATEWATQATCLVSCQAQRNADDGEGSAENK